MRRSYIFLLALALFSNCAPSARLPDEVDGALRSIRGEEIRAHMEFLADDLLEGRETGSRGYLLAARYVRSQFEAMGLSPAGENGTYYQPVPLRRASVEERGCSLAILDPRGGSTSLKYGEDFVLTPHFEGGDQKVEAPLVFAGFGISAPELGYDDFARIEASGRILLVLSGAPASFGSTERAFYSSRENKAKAALEGGATGILMIQTPVDEARRPWAVIRQFLSEPAMTWVNPSTGGAESSMNGLAIAGMLSPDAARRLFAESPSSLDTVFEGAGRGEPPRFDLGRKALVTSRSNVSDFSSENVVARLPGGSRELSKEQVVFSSHLDHVGRGTPVEGDDIYNGAYDNASGVATLLAIARAFSGMKVAPERSLVFIAVTGEENGLLGSDYFARYPSVEGELVANVNMDGVLMFHPLRDIVAFGADHSTLQEPVAKAAKILNLGLSPDFMPEEVVFIRSDQYSFVRQGVPAVYPFVGKETGNPRVDGEKILREWLVTRYHHPSDDMTQEMDFQAGADYARLELLIGYFTANTPERPRWKEGDFLGEKFAR